MDKLLVHYDSNNSGGNWWLKDDDWKKLEKAGWTIKWYKDERHPDKPDPDCEHCKGTGKDDGASHRDDRCMWCNYNINVSKDGRHMGALATRCEKEFDTIGEALKEFEKVTGQSVSDDGCNCCGAPHCFNWSSSGCINDTCNCDKNPKTQGHDDYNYSSGEGLLQYMFDLKKAPTNLREALEMLQKK